MASFKLENKSEKCFSPESHGHSAPAAAAGCRAPLPLNGCPCLCAVIWAGTRPRLHRLTLKGSPVQTHRSAGPGLPPAFLKFPVKEMKQSRTVLSSVPAPPQAFVSAASFSAFPVHKKSQPCSFVLSFTQEHQKHAINPYPQD